MPQVNLKFPLHFVVLDQKWQVLLRGYINEQRQAILTFRYNAPGGDVEESYSCFDVILDIIPPRTFPTIQFGDAEKIERFILDTAKGD